MWQAAFGIVCMALLVAFFVWAARAGDRARTKDRRELREWMDEQQLPDDVRAVIWRANDRMEAERDLYF